MIRTSDDVFIDAPAQRIQEALLHLHEDHAWWPGSRARGGYGWLELDVATGKADERIRFRVRIGESREWEGFRWFFEAGALAGSGEFWLETYRTGVIVHYLTAIEPVGAAPLRRHRWAIRAGLNALKDHLERVRV